MKSKEIKTASFFSAALRGFSGAYHFALSLVVFKASYNCPNTLVDRSYLGPSLDTAANAFANARILKDSSIPKTLLPLRIRVLIGLQLLGEALLTSVQHILMGLSLII